MSTESNKALVRRHYKEVLTAKKIGVVDQLYGPSISLGNGAAMKREQFKALAGLMHGAFPDVVVTVQDQIVHPEKTSGIRDTIARGRVHYQMQTIDQHLTDLYRAGTITLETALQAASNPSDFQRALTFE